MKHNTKTCHTDFNIANFKTIDKKFSNNKRKAKCPGFNESQT